ncbi:MAG TPA: 1-(5-phosphoribosyl)-5-[(5-phosphoribosylamino)methylideneamino] imidazole-4-carboxamide isomerase [Thermohalobaculum sp.]|nr:1-(5-phosphoribosyl)-5-[(5-phosphoribosylamino)methylideneamino] imidazole-4-carboxamide isomerase [Thermohalobaculum sp.]
MIIYPYIALRGGRCVNLLRGRIDEPVAYDVDPLQTAIGFAHAGAEWLHVVDLDAVAGTDNNAGLIREIIRHTGASVQVAGGINSAEKAHEWSDAGAGHMVVGTAAVRAPQMVKDLAYAYPDQIVISVDVWRGKVMIDGWREETAFGASEFIRNFAGWPISQFMVTDIDRDLDQHESSMALVTKLASETQTPVIASGLARSLDDISALKYLYNVSGAIVGRALYDGTFTLEEALAVARPEPEPVAQFV